MIEVPISIGAAKRAERAAILALAKRLTAFGPTTRSVAEITRRERRALAETLDGRLPGSALFVARNNRKRVVGVVQCETHEDYFTGEAHGHVGILAVARSAEGKGVGRALLQAAEEWGRRQGYRWLTLSVFVDNLRAREFYLRQGWRAEIETHFKTLSGE